MTHNAKNFDTKKGYAYLQHWFADLQNRGFMTQKMRTHPILAHTYVVAAARQLNLGEVTTSHQLRFEDGNNNSVKMLLKF